MNTKRNYITAFIGLDLLRFILSVSVVFRHYYHFYRPFNDVSISSEGINVTEEPYYNLLQAFYNNGHYAVQVFWLISGLIFYTIYNDEITENKISFGKFSFLRFTRLYPLHLLTLIIVAVLQAIFFAYHGDYFAYQSNNVGHLFLQLFLMDAWIGNEHLSFNVPAWSVSVEVFAYIVYFMVAYVGLCRGKRLFILLLFSVMINYFDILPVFNRCVMYFFFGCLLAKFIKEGTPMRSLIGGYLAAAVASIALTIVLRRFNVGLTGYLNDNFLLTLRLIPLSSLLVLVFIYVFRNLTSAFWISSMKGLGNMTYSLYLVHFPIQIIIWLVLRPQDHTVFNSPWMLFSFLGISILAGWLVYDFYEKPAQKFLRTRYEQFKFRRDQTKAIPVENLQHSQGTSSFAGSLSSQNPSLK